MMEQRTQLSPRHSPIEAIIDDGTHHLLMPSVLDVLLENNQVVKFKRSSGWVTVGIDPIRFKNRREASRSYNGHDRRSAAICWL
jgi:hypothetical protein